MKSNKYALAALLCISLALPSNIAAFTIPEISMQTFQPYIKEAQKHVYTLWNSAQSLYKQHDGHKIAAGIAAVLAFGYLAKKTYNWWTFNGVSFDKAGKEIHTSPFHYGHQHKRDDMEDAHTEINAKQISATQHYRFFGVYDGHSGRSVANYCADHLHINTFAHLEKGSHPRQALENAFADTDAAILKGKVAGGCTAIVSLIDIKTNKIYIANVADARGLVCSESGKVLAATLDHTLNPKPSDCQAIHDLTAAERARVEACGGQLIVRKDINRFTAPKCSHKYPFTRAMGDASLKKYGMSAQPAIIECTLPKNGILILACDGVWDTLTNKQAAAVVTHARKAGLTQAQAAQRLVEIAMQTGSTDNISATVVYL